MRVSHHQLLARRSCIAPDSNLPVSRDASLSIRLPQQIKAARVSESSTPSTVNVSEQLSRCSQFRRASGDASDSSSPPPINSLLSVPSFTLDSLWAAGHQSNTQMIQMTDGASFSRGLGAAIGPSQWV
ncbi:hypothetical protein VTH06DRAFT_7089 [Thermothelomyces fergusii]